MSYPNGSIITLAVDKEHFDGADTLKLKQGTCGMLVRGGNVDRFGNMIYVVDFGAYGQWNCDEKELIVDAPVERWEAPIEIPRDEAPREEIVLDPRIVFDDDTKEEAAPSFNLEADIARRMAEIESGNY